MSLNDVSPVKNIKQLRRPILLAHGEKDSNVSFSQFKLYKKKLKKHKADAVFVTYKDEGHGFSDPKNMADWLGKLEEFLEKHNPA